MATSSSVSPPLPCLLCGDLNSLPSSPLLGFLQTGQLDYSAHSATEIAGYLTPDPSRTHSRPIPIPLFPDHIGIGPDCQFRQPALKTMTTTSSSNSDSAGHSRTLDSRARGEGREEGGERDGTNEQRAVESAQKPSALLSHVFSFHSSYPHPSPEHPSTTVTTFHQLACETVDYILYTPPPNPHDHSGPTPTPTGTTGHHSSSHQDSGSGGGGFRLLRRRALPSKERLLQLGPLPHTLLPSDHLWLLASLQLLWK